MKAETNWIVWLLVVVVAAGIVLYLMWSKGIGPFSASVNEAQCKALVTQMCNDCLVSGNCMDKFLTLSNGCKSILGIEGSDYSSEQNAAAWCQNFLSS